MKWTHAWHTRLVALCATLTAAVLFVPASTAGADPHGAGAPPVREDPVVHIDSGVVRGAAAGNVETFLGLPYAAPPVRDLRWRPPQPPVPWHGVRDATHYAATCPQQLGTGFQGGNPSTNADPWPSFNSGSQVLSLVSPSPHVQSDFATVHHCAFWAAG